MPELELRIRIDDDDDLQAARETAEGQSTVELREVTRPSGGLQPEAIEPVSAIIIGAGVIAGAKFILDWWDRRKGGLVINLRRDAEEMIYRDPEVPFGYVIIFAREGDKVTVEVKDAPKDAWERLLKEVIAGTLGGQDELVKAAERLVGPEKVKREATADSEKS